MVNASNNTHANIFRWKKALLTVWLLSLSIIFYIYFFQPDFFQNNLKAVLSAGAIGFFFYFFLGCVRGFTLIPATHLTVLGLLFFPPLSLFIMTLSAILVSALCIYHFSRSFHLYKFFEHKHKKSIDAFQKALRKNELAIVIIWSLLPIVPTDLVSYTCGTLKLNRGKFLLGILIGQGIYSATLIFLGKGILDIISALF